MYIFVDRISTQSSLLISFNTTATYSTKNISISIDYPAWKYYMFDKYFITLIGGWHILM